MAKKTKTWLTDDKEEAAGNEVVADQTVEFGLDGKTYEIDLGARNATQLRKDIQKWIQFARQVHGKVKRPTPPRMTGAGADGMDATQRKAARAWLRNNGHPDLPDRGRISAELLEKFNTRPQVA